MTIKVLLLRSYFAQNRSSHGPINDSDDTNNMLENAKDMLLNSSGNCTEKTAFDVLDMAQAKNLLK